LSALKHLKNHRWMMSYKDSNESDSESFGNVETILEECGSVAEAKYLLQRLLAFSLEQGFIAAKAKA
uniref:Kinesin motor domain-containing protein n=1 Tax=Parascaris univalens TaxID=6257 RepID=A0A915AVV4_PARUN